MADSVEWFMCMCGIGIIAFAVGVGLGSAGARKAWQQEACQRGFAEYTINPTTGETKWQWKEQP